MFPHSADVYPVLETPLHLFYAVCGDTVLRKTRGSYVAVSTERGRPGWALDLKGREKKPFFLPVPRPRQRPRSVQAASSLGRRLPRPPPSTRLGSGGWSSSLRRGRSGSPAPGDRPAARPQDGVLCPQPRSRGSGHAYARQVERPPRCPVPAAAHTPARCWGLIAFHDFSPCGCPAGHEGLWAQC